MPVLERLLVVERTDEEKIAVAERLLHHRNHFICISKRLSVYIWNTYRPVRLSNQVHGARRAASTATPFSIGAAKDKALDKISAMHDLRSIISQFT